MMAADANVSFILNKIRNPCWSGKSADFRIVILDPSVTEEEEAEALAERDAAIANEQEVYTYHQHSNVASVLKIITRRCLCFLG